MSKVKVSEWVSQWVTRSPIELFWTAKNIVWCRPTIEGFKSFLGKKILPSCMLLLTRGNLPGLTWSGRKLNAGTNFGFAHLCPSLQQITMCPWALLWHVGNEYCDHICKHLSGILSATYHLNCDRSEYYRSEYYGEGANNKMTFIRSTRLGKGGKRYPGSVLHLVPGSFLPHWFGSAAMVETDPPRRHII